VDMTQASPISVPVAICRHQFERTFVEQVQEAHRGADAKRTLGCAARLAYLGGVDVCDADLFAAIPERVAIHDAVESHPPAYSEVHGTHRGACGRWWLGGE